MLFPARFARERRSSLASWTPASLASLAHWYEGDDVITSGSKITTFVDKEASSNLAQATDSLRPTYSASIASLGSQSGGEFVRASTQWIGGAFAASITQPFTVVAVWSLASVGILQDIAGSFATPRYFIRISAAGEVQIFGGSVAVASAGFGAAINTSYRGIFVFNGTSSKIRINGVSQYAGATNIGSSACGGIGLGHESSGVDYLNGRIAHAAVLSGDLIASAGDLADYETYLGKYA